MIDFHLYVDFFNIILPDGLMCFTYWKQITIITIINLLLRSKIVIGLFQSRCDKKKIVHSTKMFQLIWQKHLKKYNKK